MTTEYRTERAICPGGRVLADTPRRSVAAGLITLAPCPVCERWVSVFGVIVVPHYAD